MECLIPIINKLQDVFNTIKSDGIELPQIVVVGTQSSGKSSVLENIVGRSFLPRGTGIVTRTPLVLQLVHCPKVLGRHRRQEDGTLDVDEYGLFLHCKKIFTSFDDIRVEIEMQTKRITGSNKGISEEAITLKIYSPTVVNLTLVDLPGLTKVPVGDQPEDIEAQIRTLVLKYIENPNSIIMAVVTANTDMATNESLKLAKDCDPKGDRTLAVVTKLDLMDAGTDATDILCGRVIPVKLGIIGVINRSQKDIVSNKPIIEAQKDEAEFFQKKYPSLALCNGTSYLAQKLNQILMNHIKQCLPRLKSDVQLLITKEQARLESYGSDVTDKDAMLLNIITKFSSAYINSITGASSNLADKILVGGAHISYIFHQTFKTAVNKIDPLFGLERKDIFTLMCNSVGLRPVLFISDLAFELLAKEQIQRLEEPSIQCAQYVQVVMQNILKRCISKMEPLLKRFPVLSEKITDLVSQLLTERMKNVKSAIQSLIAMQLSYINIYHPYFDKQRALCEEEDKEERKDVEGEEYDSESEEEMPSLYSKRHAGCKSKIIKKNEEHWMSKSELKDCVKIEKLLVSYFETVRTTILDAVPKAVMYYLVNYVKENVQSVLTTSLYRSPDTKDLMEEAKHIAQDRERSSNILKTLNRANKIINEIRDFYV